MRKLLQERIELCEEEVMLARFRATLAPNRHMRSEYERLEESWKRIAEDLALALKISAHLQWSSKGLREHD